MEATTLAQYLLKNIRERDKRLKDKIADGSVSSWKNTGILWAKYAEWPTLKMKLLPR
jgi:hypothetical protein